MGLAEAVHGDSRGHLVVTHAVRSAEIGRVEGGREIAAELGDERVGGAESLVLIGRRQIGRPEIGGIGHAGDEDAARMQGDGLAEVRQAASQERR